MFSQLQKGQPVFWTFQGQLFNVNRTKAQIQTLHLLTEINHNIKKKFEHRTSEERKLKSQKKINNSETNQNQTLRRRREN